MSYKYTSPYCCLLIEVFRQDDSELWTLNQTPSPGFVNKVCWITISPIHLWKVDDWFLATAAELVYLQQRLCCMQNYKMFTIWPLAEIPGLDHLHVLWLSVCLGLSLLSCFWFIPTIICLLLSSVFFCIDSFFNICMLYFSHKATTWHNVFNFLRIQFYHHNWIISCTSFVCIWFP